MSTATADTTTPVKDGLRPINGFAWRGRVGDAYYEVVATDEEDGIATRCQVKYADEDDWGEMEDHNWSELMDLFVVDNYDVLRKATSP